MSKLIKCKIDVSKIKKEHIYKGEKGQYIELDIWINDELDNYGNDCGVKQSYKVGDNYESHYIGNGKKKIGWGDTPEPSQPVEKAEELPVGDDLPF